ncbi:MAG: LiaI-LiaF-like domain-containing protein [Nitrososphaerales archaeon]
MVATSERRHYRGGFVWPILLIGAGIVFLLNNLGMVSWDVWMTLLRLWPVILIAIGLDLLFGRRFPLGSILLGLLLVAVLVLAVQGTIPLTANASAVTVDHTETISEELNGASEASVAIRFGAGNLNVNALTEGSPQLVQGSVDLSRNEQLNRSYSANNGVADYVLESRGSWAMDPEVLAGSNKKWNLSLNRDLPTDLRVSSGVGQAALDLTGLNLRRFDLNGGVGQVTVKLPASGRYQVNIDGGVGQIIVIIPQGLAARLRTEGGLGAVSVQGNFRKDGDTYTTGDYGSAQNQAEVQVQNGVGQIVLKSLSE